MTNERKSVPKRKSGFKTLGKHYLEQVSELCFRKVKKADETNRKTTLWEVEKVFKFPYKNKRQMEGIGSRNGKWPAKLLEKHYLEKVSA